MNIPVHRKNVSTYTNFRQYVLKCMEYGSNVYFTWIYKPNYMIKETEYDYLNSVLYSQWIDVAEQMYHDVNKLLTKVRNRQIVSHRMLEDGVYRTDYENGVYVIVNYNTVPVLINGNAIDAEGFS